MNQNGITIHEDEKPTGTDRVDNMAQWREELNVRGAEVWETLKQLLQDVSVHRVVVKNADGKQLFDIPAWLGGLGALVLAPYSLIAIGVAFVARYRIEVFRRAEPVDAPATAPRAAVEETPVMDAAAAAAPSAPTVGAPISVEWDDLTAVKGIGARYAEILNAAGITTYAQIAAMDAAALRTLFVQAGARPVPNTEEWPARAALLIGNR